MARDGLMLISFYGYHKQTWIQVIKDDLADSYALFFCMTILPPPCTGTFSPECSELSPLSNPGLKDPPLPRKDNQNGVISVV